jgi:hypothetical protein
MKLLKTLAFTGCLFSTLEKIVSYFSQAEYHQIVETNFMARQLFRLVGLGLGHLIYAILIVLFTYGVYKGFSYLIKQFDMKVLKVICVSAFIIGNIEMILVLCNNIYVLLEVWKVV